MCGSAIAGCCLCGRIRARRRRWCSTSMIGRSGYSKVPAGARKSSSAPLSCAMKTRSPSHSNTVPLRWPSRRHTRCLTGSIFSSPLEPRASRGVHRLYGLAHFFRRGGPGVGPTPLTCVHRRELRSGCVVVEDRLAGNSWLLCAHDARSGEAAHFSQADTDVSPLRR